MVRKFVAFGLWFAVGCAGEDTSTGGALVLEPADPAAPPDPTEPASPPTCGPVELCARTIGECAIAMDAATCEAWYDDPASCADMDAYVTCNCDCVEEPTCDGYFSCGELCFADFC